MIHRCYRLSWAIVLLLLGGSVAHAVGRCPDKPADKKRARRLATDWWRAAVRLYEIGSYKEAVRTWQCAYRLAPHPLALFNIAKAAERAGDFDLAFDYYQRYQKTAPGARVRQALRAALNRVRQKIRQRRPRPGLLPTGPPGKRRGSAGKRVPPLAIAGWSLVGVAGALACMAGAFGGLALRARSKLDGADPGTPWNPDLVRVVADYDRYRIATWASVGLGLVTLVTGAALLIVNRVSSGKNRQSEQPSHGLSLQVSRDGVSVAAVGRF